MVFFSDTSALVARSVASVACCAFAYGFISRRLFDWMMYHKTVHPQILKLCKKKDLAKQKIKSKTDKHVHKDPKYMKNTDDFKLVIPQGRRMRHTQTSLEMFNCYKSTYGQRLPPFVCTECRLFAVYLCNKNSNRFCYNILYSDKCTVDDAMCNICALDRARKAMYAATSGDREDYSHVRKQIGFTINHKIEVPLVDEIFNFIKTSSDKLTSIAPLNTLWAISSFIVDIIRDWGNVVFMLKHFVSLLFSLGFPSECMMLAQQSIKNCFDYVVNKQFDFEEFSFTDVIINNIAKAIFCICCLWAYKKLPGKQDIDTFLRRMDLFPKALNGFAAFFTFCSKMFDESWNYIASNYFNCSPVIISKATDIPTDLEKFSKEVLNLSSEISKTEFAKSDKTVEHIEYLFRESNRLLEYLTKLKFDRHIMDYWRTYHMQLCKVKEQAELSGANFLKIRTKPLCIQIYGEPGQGKSEMMYPLTMDLWASENIGNRQFDAKDFEKEVYQRRVTNEFWDGYNTAGHNPYAVWYDDFGTKKDTVANPNPEFEEVIHAVGETPYQLHMSRTEDKQNVFFTSKLVLLSSNFHQYQTLSMTNPHALTRRIHVSACVRAKKEYLHEYVDAKGKVMYQIDPTKVNSRGYAEQIYEIDIVDATGKIRKLPNGKELKNLSYTEFVAWCVKARSSIRKDASEKRQALMDRAERLNNSPEQYFSRFDIDGHQLSEMFIEVEPQMFSYTSLANWQLPFIGRQQRRVYFRNNQVFVRLDNSEFWDDFINYRLYILPEYEQLWQDMSNQCGYDQDKMNIMFENMNVNPYDWFKGETLGQFVGIRWEVVKDVACSHWEKITEKIPFKQIFKLLGATVAAVAAVFSFYKIFEYLFSPKVQTTSYSNVRNFTRGNERRSERGEEKMRYEPKQEEVQKLTTEERGVLDKLFGYFPIISRKKGEERTLVCDSKSFHTPGLPSVRYNSKPFHTPGLPKVVMNKQDNSAEFSVDPNTTQILQSILSKNMYSIHVGDERGGGRALQGTFIRGRLLLTNRHFLECFVYGCEAIELRSLFGKETIKINAEDVKVKSIRAHFPDNYPPELKDRPEFKYKDAILIQFPDSVPQHRDITKYFVTRQDQAVFRDADCALYVVNDFFFKGKHGEIDMTPILVAKYGRAYAHDMSFNIDAQKKNPMLIETVGFPVNIDINANQDGWFSLGTQQKEIVQLTRDYYSYDFDTSNGDCGSLLCVRETNLKRKILGIHFAGSKSTFNRVKNYTIAITQEDLLEAIQDVECTAQMEPMMPANVGYVEIPMLEIDLPDEPNQYAVLPSVSIKIPQNNLFVHGSVNVKVHAATETKLRKSIVYNRILPPISKPTALTPIVVDGNLIDPMKQGLEKVARIPRHVNQSLIELCVTETFERKYMPVGFSEKWMTQYARVLSYEEAITGIDGVPYYESMKRGTSAGYPWAQNTVPENKKKWLGDGDYFIVDHPDLKKVCTARDEANRQGIRYPTCWTDTLKDERRPVEKVRLGKTRVFCGSPMDFSLNFRRYFLGFIAHVMQNHDYNGVSVGINPFDNDWQMLAKLMSKQGPYVVAGDFENFDGTLLAQLLWAIVRNINLWYRKYDPNWNLGDDKARLALAAEVINSVHICGDIIYGWLFGLTSGCPATAIWNSIYNNCAVLLVYMIVSEQKCPSMCRPSKFFQNVTMVAYGDDNVININPAIINWFNGETLASGFEQIGMKYTDELKTGVISKFKYLHEIQYLKRSFQYDDNLGRYVAPLQLDVIMEMPNWVRGDLSPVACAHENALNALQELSLHSKKVWDDNAPLIYQAFESVKHPLEYKSRNDFRLDLIGKVSTGRGSMLTCGDVEENPGPDMLFMTVCGFVYVLILVYLMDCKQCPRCFKVTRKGFCWRCRKVTC